MNCHLEQEEHQWIFIEFLFILKNVALYPYQIYTLPPNLSFSLMVEKSWHDRLNFKSLMRLHSLMVTLTNVLIGMASWLFLDPGFSVLQEKQER